jgi:pimeloyl-ACP methyl ester carboxylesterase
MVRWICLSVMCLPALTALAAGQAATRPAVVEVEPALAKGPLLLHLPGIAGYRGYDRRMLAGLRAGGVKGHMVVYDWTENDPGIGALVSYQRNQAEAGRIADLIVAHAKADPGAPIDLTAHSGGCGLAVWALEKLPADVSVETVLLMAPALSPTYDLSKSLHHVQGRMYVFSSRIDGIVLDAGTRVFGTIDGIRTEAAGFGGFVQPAGADAAMYGKLVGMPYRSDWMRYGNFGEHIGALSRPFAEAVLAPLLDVPQLAATTRPAVEQ